MYDIPTSLTIQGRKFNITNKGDYRMILDCFNALNDSELEEQQRICAALLIFYDEINSLEDLAKFGDSTQEAIEKMFDFMNCNQQNAGKKVNYKIIDWEKDAQLIFSSVNNVAKTEVRLAEYIHWWTFMGYYSSIGESTLSTVVAIRDKITKGKKLEKWEREFRTDNPQYFNWDMRTAEQQEADELINKIWNK